MQNDNLRPISRPDFLNALRFAGRFCFSNPKVRLECDGEHLNLIGADPNEDTFGVFTIAGSGAPGTIDIPHQVTSVWLDQIGAEAVFVEKKEGDGVTITAGDEGSHGIRRLCLNAPQTEDPLGCPPTDGQPGEITVTVNGREFAAALQAVLPFAPKPQRWQPPAVFLSVNPEDLTIAACDGARFSQQRVPLIGEGGGSNGERQIAVPPPVLATLVKLLRSASANASLTINVSGTFVLFTAQGVEPFLSARIASRLLEERLNTEKLAANFGDSAGTVTFERRVLTRALGRLKRIAVDDSNRVELRISGGCVVLHAHSYEFGDACEEMTAVHQPSDATRQIVIGFDLRRLLNTLQTDKSKQVVVTYQDDPLKAVLIGQALLMPLAPRSGTRTKTTNAQTDDWKGG